MTPRRWPDADLHEALDALRQAEARAVTPARVEAAVLAAWDAGATTRAHRSQTTAFTTRSWHPLGALIAAAMIVLALGTLARQLQQSTRQSADSETRRTVVLVGEPILQGEPVRLVRMRLPAATLAALGIHSPQTSEAGHVDVDVIVGEDGVARAIQVGM